MGRSVGKIIVILLSVGVGTTKNKNVDNGVKGTSVIMSTQVTYEIDHISLLQDSKISSVLNFCFWYVLLLSKRKKSHVKGNTNSKKRNVFVEMKIQYYYFGLPKIRVGPAHTTKN